MGKKDDFYQFFDEPKKSKKKHYSENGYNHKDSEEIADQLENFLNDISRFVIIIGKKYSSVKKARKVIKETIKDLRKGREEKVFDEEGYEEYVNGHYE